MLHSLSVRNLVLIDQLDLTFDSGLCALTGETGAGKSILLDALGLALGGRAEARLLRPGANQASVVAVFDIGEVNPIRERLVEHGIDLEEPSLILRRSLGADGRSRAFVNDQPVAVGLLRSLGTALVEIQGQFEQHSLLDGARHRIFLDAFGGLAEPAGETARLWYAWQEALGQYREAEQTLAKASVEEAFLRHAVEEMAALDPQVGEAESLAEQRARLMHREQLVETMNQAGAALSGDGSAEGSGGGSRGGAEQNLDQARHLLDVASAKAAGGLDETIAALDRAAADLAGALAGMESFSAGLDLDAGELTRIEDRFFAYQDLARKHATKPDRLTDLYQDFTARLATLESGTDHLDALNEAVAAARQTYLDAARSLSSARSSAAGEMDAAVNAELPPLKLDKAQFTTKVTASEEEGNWGPQGLDSVAFEARTNPGMPLGPVGRIASGGELARFLLAIKVVLAGLGPPVTLVFDEVDSGIGGGAAHAVGERLARLAEGRQVLVVTHSPQVAARATHHWQVSKQQKGGETRSRVRPLDSEERQEEIARMLSGAEVTDEARAAAGRLIGAA
jgi:DNA repair protein RecN (Recombination protein N)